jgi:hypothetical protein
MVIVNQNPDLTRVKARAHIPPLWRHPFLLDEHSLAVGAQTQKSRIKFERRGSLGWVWMLQAEAYVDKLILPCPTDV